MKDSGRVTKKLAWVATSIPISQSTSGTITKTDRMGSAFSAGPTATHTKVSGKMAYATAPASSNSPNKTRSMLVNSNRTNLKVEATLSIPMGRLIRGASGRIKGTDSARAAGLMAANMSAFGKTVRKMVWGACSLPRAKFSPIPGAQANVFQKRVVREILTGKKSRK